MRRLIITSILCAAACAARPGEGLAGEREAPVIINHLCTDLRAVPIEAIEAAQESCRWHYARMSHGRQIMVGLGRIEDADPVYRADWPASGGSLPEVPGALCIYTDPADPSGYWAGSGIDRTRSILEANPALNVSAFCWCTQLNTAPASYVDEYLTAMQTLEMEYPGVTFVYFTGTAEYDGGYGYNRALRNEQIRQFCIANDKVLYDFEDLDSWWYDPVRKRWEQATYLHNGMAVPVEHPNLAGSDAEHTSYESCEQKGRAAWWLMAMLAGWTGMLAVGDDAEEPAPEGGAPRMRLTCRPNPCNPATTIHFTLEEAVDVDLSIYDAAGRRVRTLLRGPAIEGPHEIPWNGTGDSGRPLASGVYFYRLRAGKKALTDKVLLLR